jgi:hypothetical protein
MFNRLAPACCAWLGPCFGRGLTSTASSELRSFAHVRVTLARPEEKYTSRFPPSTVLPFSASGSSARLTNSGRVVKQVKSLLQEEVQGGTRPGRGWASRQDVWAMGSRRTSLILGIVCLGLTPVSNLIPKMAQGRQLCAQPLACVVR